MPKWICPPLSARLGDNRLSFFWKTLPPYLFVSYWWGKKDHGFPNRVISLYRHLSKSTNSCVIFTLLSSRLFSIKTLSVNSWKNFQTTHLKSQKLKQIIRRPKTFDQLGKCKFFGRYFFVIFVGPRRPSLRKTKTRFQFGLGSCMINKNIKILIKSVNHLGDPLASRIKGKLNSKTLR